MSPSPWKRRPSGSPSETPSRPDRHEGKIVGFRAWGLNAKYRLESPYAGGEWPLRPKRAENRHLSDGAGWYAYYDLEKCFVREFREFKGHKLAGAIAGWGETFVYPTGFRCEYAEIVALCYDRDWPKPFIAAMRVIASDYGAQLCVPTDLKAIASEFGHVLSKDYYDSLPRNMYPADHSW